MKTNREVMMFEDVILSGNNREHYMNKWSMVLISFFIHMFIMAIILIGPFLNTDVQLPDLKIVDVFVSHAPIMPQSLRAAKKITQKITKLVDKKEDIKRKMSYSKSALILPIEIPDEIIDEDDELILKDIAFGSGGGVESGIEGGYDDGVIGGSLLGQIPVRISYARRIKYVKPIYPPEALNAKMGAAVVLEAITDVFGRIASWKILSGHSLFNDAAIDAVRQWEYEPYILDGIPKPVVLNVTVNFMPFLTSTDLDKTD